MRNSNKFIENEKWRLNLEREPFVLNTREQTFFFFHPAILYVFRSLHERQQFFLLNRITYCGKFWDQFSVQFPFFPWAFLCWIDWVFCVTPHINFMLHRKLWNFPFCKCYRLRGFGRKEKFLHSSNRRWRKKKRRKSLKAFNFISMFHKSLLVASNQNKIVSF